MVECYSLVGTWSEKKLEASNYKGTKSTGWTMGVLLKPFDYSPRKPSKNKDQYDWTTFFRGNNAFDFHYEKKSNSLYMMTETSICRINLSKTKKIPPIHQRK